MSGSRSAEDFARPAGYRPRVDCSDVPHDSDDHWLTQQGVQRRVADILRENEGTTAGLGEVPLSLTSQEIVRRLTRWEPRLAYLGRAQETDDGRLYHWMVAELIAHEALHEWWSQALIWPLGWWPWDHGPTAPELPLDLRSPQPFRLDK